MKLRYVGNAPFFSALSEEDQGRVSQRMHLEYRRSGEALFHKGDTCSAIFLIKSGWVRLIANGGTALASQGPGSLVGETDLFLDRPHSIGASIATDAELWVLDREDLIDLIAEFPQIGLQLTLAFGSRLSLFDQYLVKHRIKPLPFLSGVKEETLTAVARRLTPMEKKKGEFIIESGKPPEALFIVELGQVHLLSSEEGGDFSAIGPGETFGEMALLTGKPHAHSAQAASDVILWALPASEFDALSEERPDIRLALSRAIREPLQTQDMGQAVERLSAMSLFSTLSEETLWAVAERLLLRHVPAKEQIFAQGDQGDALYLIDTGQVEIVSSALTGPTVLARLSADEFFGEMALLTGKPRSTAARAATHTNLWVLYRSDFDDLVNRHPSISLALSKVLSERLAEMDRRFTESHMRGLKLLAGLSSSQLEDVSRRLKPVRYRQGEIIIHEGEPGNEMYFIESGRVRVKRGDGPNTVAIAEMGAGDLFGEMALLTESSRSATVVAVSDLELWVLSQADFNDLVTAYPNLALALSRLLSERLRHTDERFLTQPVAPTVELATTPLQPEPSVEPRRAARRTREARKAPKTRSLRRRPARSLTADLSERFEGIIVWYDSLSRGAKWRLALIMLLLAWLVGIAAPAMVISTLVADDVTSLQGAIAFVRTATPVPQTTDESAEAIPEAEVGLLPEEPAAKEIVPPSEEPVEILKEVVKEQVVVPVQEPPTATPWVIVVTDTPLPPTDTPIPPTETPVPPTNTPPPAQAAVKPPAPRPTSTPAPVERTQPPRNLDPRLSALGVVIEPAGVKAGQNYWRLVDARWENESEAGGGHSIFVEVLDESGSRIVNQPVEIRWVGGNLTVTTEDKPKPEYGTNFPMYNTLGSYSVSIPGLPSDTVVGLGLGSIDQPDFKVHTNFFLVFKRVQR